MNLVVVLVSLVSVVWCDNTTTTTTATTTTHTVAHNCSAFNVLNTTDAQGVPDLCHLCVEEAGCAWCAPADNTTFATCVESNLLDAMCPHHANISICVGPHCVRTHCLSLSVSVTMQKGRKNNEFLLFLVHFFHFFG
jgi:hypothetical protein